MVVLVRNKRSPWVLLVLVLIGGLIGGFLGEALSYNPYFTWMSFGGVNGYKELFSFSLKPAFDFRIIRFGFDLALNVNAGSIFGMIVAIIVYMRIKG